MALARTLLQIRTACKRQVDQEFDSHISDAEWNIRISTSYGKLHAIAAVPGSRFFETEATIAADGSSSYSLPSDHLSTIAVDFVVDAAGTRRRLVELMQPERPYAIGQTGEARYWELSGSSIALYPKPSGGSYKHLYIMQPTDYSASADGTSIDVLNVWGLDFLVNDVCVAAGGKSESDVRLWMAERKTAHDELQYLVTLRSIEARRPASMPGFDDRDPDFWSNRQ